MELSFDPRFRGPLTSANGGYAAGRLAAYVSGDVAEITLRLPPPLERPLEVRQDGDLTLLLDGEAVVAEGRGGTLDLEPPPPVSREQAEVAHERHVRGSVAAFRECFVCGEREEGDGLRVHVGAVPGREPLHAAPWIVGESRPEIVWAAIDCPGAYAVGAEGRGDVVLGRMTARVSRVPDVGEDCVVVAWPVGESGRKLFAGTALFDHAGELLALAHQVWIVPRSSEE